MKNKNKINKKPSFIERVGKKIPDPVIIFIALYAIVMLTTLFMGGKTFSTLGADGGSIVYEIKNMFQTENVRISHRIQLPTVTVAQNIHPPRLNSLFLLGKAGGCFYKLTWFFF